MGKFDRLQTHISPRQVTALERSDLTVEGILALDKEAATVALLEVRGIGPATVERILEALAAPPAVPNTPDAPLSDGYEQESGPLDPYRVRIPPEERQAGKATASPRITRARESQGG